MTSINLFCDFKGRVNAIKPSHRRTKAAWDTQEVTGNPSSTSSLGTNTMVKMPFLAVLVDQRPVPGRAKWSQHHQNPNRDHRARSQR